MFSHYQKHKSRQKSPKFNKSRQKTAKVNKIDYNLVDFKPGMFKFGIILMFAFEQKAEVSSKGLNELENNILHCGPFV